LALGLPETGAVVAVSGGSLGARRINDATLDLVSRWATRPDVAIYHVVGERDWDAMQAAAPAAVPGGLFYRQVRFEDRMDRLYAAADVAVQRAGASTVFELAAAGLPAVLVPLPHAPGDHQSFNARQLGDVGAAVVVADAALSGARLAAELDRLLQDPSRLASMAAAAVTISRPDAADAVARLAEEHARA
jgi:UDP-N-acetylglucosamine--N-acetylmuramyl-(pentapeptide) pyrophosphoryl-undecaprenol N-acetylglucosamine transferase